MASLISEHVRADSLCVFGMRQRDTFELTIFCENPTRQKSYARLAASLRIEFDIEHQVNHGGNHFLYCQ